MKAMNPLSALTAFLSLIAFSCLSLHAADGIWKADSGTGTWSNPDQWVDENIAGGSGSLASFQVPGTGGEYDITLDENLTLAELRQLGSGWSSTYRLLGPGTLTFAPEGRIGLSATETSNLFLRGFVIESAVSGSGGLEISGSGRRQYIVWNPATMGLTGGITLNGAGLQVASAAALGANTITMSGTGVSFLGFTGDGENYSQSIVLDSSTSGFMNFISSGSITADPPTHYISGKITQTSGGNRGLQYMTGTNTPGGTRFVVSGDNAYTGTTTISASQVADASMNSGPIVVRATHKNAFGSGTSAVIQILNSASGIELDGGITISGKTARLNGEGFRGQGSLNSVSGDNTWSGNLVLRYGTDRSMAPTIGVESDTLTVSGVISDGNSSDGLRKVGEGTLILTQANSYASGTSVLEGTLLADHHTALGTGAVNINGGRLAVAQGRSIQNTITFGAQGGALSGRGCIASSVALSTVEHRLEPGEGTGTLEFQGGQSWSGFTYTWDLDDWTGAGESFDRVFVDGQLTLSLAGEYRLVAGFAGSALPEDFDAGTNREWTILLADELIQFDATRWTLVGFNEAVAGVGVWNLTQAEDGLMLSYQAIPEPATAFSMGIGMLLLYGVGRRRREGTL